ncbi:TetR/AcrR family transcriptional regulator [Rhodococcus maanshanensis]|uniref:TetR/AcrR family transcriptional regulator n=1 Tax=Rhodococcus maanshanensis TaxID=183556 RepID=UPI000B8854C2|nr:TetR/AcrR family transcriptional regulator [Rhodococcus maanshanensis]
MSPSKKEQTATTTRALLAVAVEMFADRGYGAVGLDDVARQSGLTRGAVYHHFGSKAGLFDAVVEQVQREVAERVGHAAAAAGNLWDALVVGCHEFVRAGSDRRVHRIMLIDAPAVLGWQRWRELDAANSGRLLQEVLDELQAEGTIAPGLAEPAAHLLSGAMNEAVLWVAQSEVPGRDRESALATLDHLLGSLRQR